MLKIGHRGQPTCQPENTLASFDAAITAGANGLECDLRACIDDIVVIHDDSLLRTHGIDAPIVHMTAQQLRQHNVPTLAALLDHIPSHIALFLELKDRHIGADVARALMHRGHRNITIISFYEQALRAAYAVNPLIKLGANCCYAEDAAPLYHSFLEITPGHETEDVVNLLAGFPELTSIQPKHTLITPDVIAAAHVLHTKIYSWTVNEISRAEQLVSYSIDGIITDDVRII